ncbi:hypothetical protein M0R45_036385 [Rubus argutus]|uniref:Uncharacterized protein n=1 Tax=Rubus argutus TaxID=59490 RepID=A0AAW1VVZ9_RUBAR
MLEIEVVLDSRNTFLSQSLLREVQAGEVPVLSSSGGSSYGGGLGFSDGKAREEVHGAELFELESATSLLCGCGLEFARAGGTVKR